MIYLNTLSVILMQWRQVNGLEWLLAQEERMMILGQIENSSLAFVWSCRETNDVNTGNLSNSVQNIGGTLYMKIIMRIIIIIIIIVIELIWM
jgi:hypothetical protein